jgi:hypothetical protein
MELSTHIDKFNIRIRTPFRVIADIFLLNPSPINQFHPTIGRSTKSSKSSPEISITKQFGLPWLMSVLNEKGRISGV